MANNLKGYDAFQVLRSVFDVDKNCLRVCIVDGSSGGSPVEVIVDHTTDSIRLGDGTSLVTATILGSKVGIDVNQLNIPTVTSPLVTNVTYGTINLEMNHAFQSGTKRFMVRFRGRGKMNLSFIVGTTGTNFITLYPGTFFTEEDISNTGTLTLFYRANNTGVVEILEWT